MSARNLLRNLLALAGMVSGEVVAKIAIHRRPKLCFGRLFFPTTAVRPT